MERSYFQYFISMYFVFVLIFGIMLVLEESLNLDEKTLLIFGMPFILSLFTAPLVYYVYPPTDSHYRARKNKKKPFKTFARKHHFQVTEDNYLAGKIEDFLVIIHAARSKSMMHEWIEITIYFHPKREHEFIPINIINQLQDKYITENVTWYVNSVLIKQHYLHFTPKFKQIYALVQRCISDLKSQQIVPISVSDWKQIIPETEAHYNPPENL